MSSGDMCGPAPDSPRPPQSHVPLDRPHVHNRAGAVRFQLPIAGRVQIHVQREVGFWDAQRREGAPPRTPLPPPSRTNWTRLVPPSVLTRHATPHPKTAPNSMPKTARPAPAAVLGPRGVLIKKPSSPGPAFKAQRRLRHKGVPSQRAFAS